MFRPACPILSTLLPLALGPLTGPVQAQEEEPPTPEEVQAAESAPLFSSHETLKLTLEADFHTMRRTDRAEEDSEERPAIMRWIREDGSTATQEIQVQTRGNFRLLSRNCDFPPLRLNVKTEPTKGTIFEGQDKLKLVVTCKLGQRYWEEYVVAEYLVYRMLNLLTPFSFRVRPALVTYVDSSGKDDTFTRYAFLIEDDDAMATRNGGLKVDWDQERLFNARALDQRQATLLEIFQFMIGNTDWSSIQMHNVELVRVPPDGYFVVPFDFDFSGIVDTRYARPDSRLPIRSVRERLFRGYCPEELGRTQDEYLAVFDAFRQKKDEIYALWQNQEGLGEKRVKDTRDYLDDFFEILSDPAQIQRRIMDQCRRIQGQASQQEAPTLVSGSPSA